MIYIVRHGQTGMNKARLLQGRRDSQLNEKGIEQAKQLGARFLSLGVRFDLVYSSPLRRAVDTARLIVGNGCEPITDERLLEMDYGPYEGTSLVDPAPEVAAFFNDFTNCPAPEGMEPLSSVIARLGEFMEDVRAACEGRNVLIATHAIAMKGALEYLTPGSAGAYWSKYIGNCEVYSAELIGGAFSVPEKTDFL